MLLCRFFGSEASLPAGTSGDTYWDVLATGGGGGSGGVGVGGQRARPLLRVVLVLAGFVEVHAAGQTWGGFENRFQGFSAVRSSPQEAQTLNFAAFCTKWFFLAHLFLFFGI